jgi:anti-anti-sigma factor
MTDLAQDHGAQPTRPAIRRSRAAKDGGRPPQRRLRRSRFFTHAGPAAVTSIKDTCPVRWVGGQAVVTLPGHIDGSNASQISEQLLSVINRGATELIVDMTATGSCDHAGAAAVARAYQRAAANGTQLRLVIIAGIVRRVLSLNGLDQVIPVYPSLETAGAGAEHRGAPAEPEIVEITPAMPGITVRDARVTLMLAGESRNLPTVLEKAEAVYRGSAGQLPAVGRDGLAQRAAHLAAGVRLALDEPEAMRRLLAVTGDLNGARLDWLLPRLLDGALSLMGADFGTLQLLDPVSGSLWLVTQSGFSQEFLDHFAVVGDGHSACGRAAQAGAQIVIADVTTDRGFAPHRQIAAAAGVRAVQATPLADYAGRLIGVVSTHFARPHRPPARDLRVMELYGDFAGEAVARQLGVPAGDGVGEPAGRAVIAALLDPGDSQPPDPGGHEGLPAHQPASLEEVMSGFAAEIVNRLFSVGLGLDSARSFVGDGPAGDRVAAATDEVDRTIRDIRTTMFSLAAEARKHSPNRWPPPPVGHADRTRDLLDSAMDSIFEAGVALHAAADLASGATRGHIAEALGRLDDVAQAIHDHVFAGRAEPRLAWGSALARRQRSARAADRAALRERVGQTARALEAAAANTAALLERRADLVEQPGRMDYPTEIKRWRAFADQAGQMAKRWEQPP